MITLSRPRGLHLFFTLRGSILPRVARSLALCVAVAALVTFTHGVLFHWTAVPFSIIGLALAIAALPVAVVGDVVAKAQADGCCVATARIWGR